VIKPLLFALGIYATSQFAQSQTDGFAINKLSTQIVEKNSPSFDESLLSQRFFYLAKGGQCYVFVSEDGNYVLKFFRASRLNMLNLLPTQTLEKKREKARSDLIKAIDSYQLAYAELKEETGLVGTHFGESLLEAKTIQIVDKLGIEHTIDTKKYPFVLQIKAMSVTEKVEELMARGDRKKAAKALSQLFDLIEKTAQKGIGDKDPNLVKNFGFVGNEPIQMDGGSFSSNSRCSVRRVAESKEDLRHWLSQKYPELSKHLEEEYAAFIDKVL